MGIICPGVQEVGHRKSGDQMSSGPNASQPFFSLFSQLSLVQPDEESYLIFSNLFSGGSHDCAFVRLSGCLLDCAFALNTMG